LCRAGRSLGIPCPACFAQPVREVVAFRSGALMVGPPSRAVGGRSATLVGLEARCTCRGAVLASPAAAWSTAEIVILGGARGLRGSQLLVSTPRQLHHEDNDNLVARRMPTSKTGSTFGMRSWCPCTAASSSIRRCSVARRAHIDGFAPTTALGGGRREARHLYRVNPSAPQMLNRAYETPSPFRRSHSSTISHR